MIENNYVVIMAGGVGTRLWPYSKQSFPKQFHDVLGSGRTLIQQTADRFDGVCLPENMYVVTTAEYFDLCKEQLPFLNSSQILIEPARRNTAPCIAFACYKIGKLNPNANIVVAPADHVILKEEAFKAQITKALDFSASNDCLVTLGIKPSRPDTGYGYIQFEEEGDETSDVKKVKAFTEKPNFDLAMKFLESGDYVWNAGIFVWTFPSIQKAFQDFLPEMDEAMLIANPSFFTDNEKVALETAYPRCKKISIDNGIMEKAQNVHVVLSDIGWTDLGTWKSVFENSEKDEFANAIDAKVLLYNTRNSMIKVPKDKLVVINGLDGYIVAENDGVLMICKKEDEQLVKQFVADATNLDANLV